MKTQKERDRREKSRRKDEAERQKREEEKKKRRKECVISELSSIQDILGQATSGLLLKKQVEIEKQITELENTLVFTLLSVTKELK